MTRKASKKPGELSPEPIREQAGVALTISEFCDRVGINPVTFHRHRKNMPRSVRVGAAVRIPIAAIVEWERQQLEREQRRQQSAR